MSEQKKDIGLAWEVARNLANLTNDEREKIFGYSDLGSIIRNHSVLVVYHKIMEYEEELKKERISVGEIVKCNSLWEGIVIYIDYDDEMEVTPCSLAKFIIFSDGAYNTFSRKELTKTGKSVDILKVLSDLILG